MSDDVDTFAIMIFHIKAKPMGQGVSPCKGVWDGSGVSKEISPHTSCEAPLTFMLASA